MTRHSLTPFFTPLDNPRGRVYLSGPMTGHKNDNASEFSVAATDLRSAGYAICNPVETSEILGPLSHARYLRFDFARVMEADFLVVLDNWETSPGARAEVHMAVTMGTKVWRYNDQREVGLEEAQAAIVYSAL